MSLNCYSFSEKYIVLVYSTVVYKEPLSALLLMSQKTVKKVRKVTDSLVKGKNEAKLSTVHKKGDSKLRVTFK